MFRRRLEGAHLWCQTCAYGTLEPHVWYQTGGIRLCGGFAQRWSTGFFQSLVSILPALTGSTTRGFSFAYFGRTSPATQSSWSIWLSPGWSRMNWLTPASTYGSSTLKKASFDPHGSRSAFGTQ